MHGDAELLRDVAAPVVLEIDAIRVRCGDILQEVFAHQIAAIVLAAVPLQGAVVQADGLELIEERLFNGVRRRRPKRLFLRDRAPLAHQHEGATTTTIPASRSSGLRTESLDSPDCERR